MDQALLHSVPFAVTIFTIEIVKEIKARYNNLSISVFLSGCFCKSCVFQITEEATAYFYFLVLIQSPPPPTRTHPWHPSRRRVARVNEYVRMYVTCYYGFSPRREATGELVRGSNAGKTQTHTDIPSGCTQDHWQAVIESVSIWVSLVAMNECLTWISHTTWWMSSMRLKNACFEYMLVHNSLFL